MLTLTPQARALASFALAIMLLQGPLLRVAGSIIGLFGDSFPDGRGGTALAGLIGIAICLGVILLARSSAGPGGGWEMHVAQGALLIAAIALGLESLATVDLLIYPDGSGFIAYFPGVASLADTFRP